MERRVSLFQRIAVRSLRARHSTATENEEREIMHTVTELDILLREGIELPASLRIAKEDFQNGWKFALTANAQELETQVHASGWNLIKIADQLQASGVGETAQEAVASGLRLALLRMNVGNNAAAVESIELTKYPWFELARVKVRPICIQQSATLAVSDDRVSTPVARRQRGLPLSAAALYPDFGRDMPQLKQMLVSSRSMQMEAQ